VSLYVSVYVCVWSRMSLTMPQVHR